MKPVLKIGVTVVIAGLMAGVAARQGGASTEAALYAGVMALLTNIYTYLCPSPTRPRRPRSRKQADAQNDHQDA